MVETVRGLDAVDDAGDFRIAHWAQWATGEAAFTFGLAAVSTLQRLVSFGVIRLVPHRLTGCSFAFTALIGLWAWLSGFQLIPRESVFVFMTAGSLLMLCGSHNHTMRMDYSLFLRAAQGMLPKLRADSDSEAPPRRTMAEQWALGRATDLNN